MVLADPSISAGGNLDGEIVPDWLRQGVRWVVFDLDGTLTTTEVMAHLGRTLVLRDKHEQRRWQALDQQIQMYESGQAANYDVSVQFARLLKDRTKAELQGAVNDIPKIADIEIVVDALHAAKIACALSTVTFDFAAEAFQERYGFKHIAASELIYDARDVCAGEIKHVREATDKLNDIWTMPDNPAPPDIAFVGNGRSDVEVMSAVGVRVALNPTCDDLDDVACATIHSDTLKTLLTAPSLECGGIVPCTHRS